MNTILCFEIITEYIAYCIGIIVAIYCVIKIYKYIVKKESMFTSKYQPKIGKEITTKYSKQSHIIAITFMTIWIVLVIMTSTIMLPEIPNIINKKYKIAECKIQYSKESNPKHKMYCTVNNKRINIVEKYYVKEGTTRQIKYLEFFQYGWFYNE